MLGVEKSVVEDARIERDQLVLVVRPNSHERSRCPHCDRRRPRYDAGDGTRRWRALDIGRTPVVIEAQAPRVKCPKHGVIVARVPWARHRSTFTRSFEDQVSWLAQQMSKSAVSLLMRVAWETVGDIIKRVVDERREGFDPLDGLRRIGIDEVSYRKGHKYLIVVVDHDSGRIVWSKEGRDSKTLAEFFDALGPQRCAKLREVSADAANWIGKVVRERCPQAVLCIDPFHVVAWANDALDEVRRSVWNEARKSGAVGSARSVKGMRYVVGKNPENLTPNQRVKLSALEKLNGPLFRAYLLKEALREAFVEKGEEGVALLGDWLKWAQRSRLDSFVELGRRVKRHREGIEAALLHGLSNARVEATNNQVRLLTRVAHGFHSAGALIAMLFLKLGGLDIRLPSQPRLA
jgi:transposase